MAYWCEGGAVVDAFMPHNLTVKEAWAIYHARYPGSSDMKLPSGWRLSTCSIDIPPMPVTHENMWWGEIHAAPP
jgi:hypothetical protein